VPILNNDPLAGVCNFSAPPFLSSHSPPPHRSSRCSHPEVSLVSPAERSMVRRRRIPSSPPPPPPPFSLAPRLFPLKLPSSALSVPHAPPSRNLVSTVQTLHRRVWTCTNPTLASILRRSHPITAQFAHPLLACSSYIRYRGSCHYWPRQDRYRCRR